MKLTRLTMRQSGCAFQPRARALRMLRDRRDPFVQATKGLPARCIDIAATHRRSGFDQRRVPPRRAERDAISAPDRGRAWHSCEIKPANSRHQAAPEE